MSTATAFTPSLPPATAAALPKVAAVLEECGTDIRALGREIDALHQEMRTGRAGPDARTTLAARAAEIAQVRADQKAVEAEAVYDGMRVDVLREAIRLRRMAPHRRAQWDATLRLYRAALDIPDEGAPAGGAS